MISDLYEKDFAEWLQLQTIALKAKNWEAVDIEHLIENLEMGDPKTSLESDLLILIAHLLKLYFQRDAPDWMNKSWYNSIDEHRLRIQRSLEKSGLLRRYLPDAINLIYPKARKLAIKEGKRADGRKVMKPKESDYPEQFPNEWLENLLNEDCYPVNE